MLILVHGVPGVGKSTFAAKLSADLGVRYIAQDMIKEFYADTLGGSFTNEQSSAMGRAAKQSVLELARELTETGVTLIVEGAFHADAATPVIDQLPNGSVIQVYVTCDPEEARRRFQQRVGSDARHAIHTDTLYESAPVDAIWHGYRQLDTIGMRTMVYDTTREDDDTYRAIVTELRKVLDHATTN